MMGRTPTLRLGLVAATALTLAGSPEPVEADVFSNVAEASGMKLIYELNIQNQADYLNGASVPYVIDHAAQISGGYNRVGYYLELDTGSGLEWVYVSMDDFAQGRAWSLGLPHNVDNPVAHQTTVTNANIVTNVPGKVTAGTGLSAVNVEMWPGNYGPTNTASVPGASDAVFDYGDQNTGGIGSGHGSFQVHNHGAGQTLLAYNDWGGNSSGSNDELGIGNNTSAIGVQQTATVHPDWTFQDTTNVYTVKRLQIVVDAATPTIDARDVAVDARHYELVHSLDVPNSANYNTSAIPYSVDNSNLIPTNSFGRIGYYVQLDNDWVWVSADAFTSNASEIGVPASNAVNGNGGVSFEQNLAGMNVESNKAGIVTGTNIATGNIEFWSTNYTTTNNDGLPSSNGGAYDHDDEPTPGGYGSMQIHNHGSDQTLFAYNRWGSSGASTSDLGIGDRADANTDWTFAQNANTYSTRVIQTYVLPNVFLDVAEANDYTTVYGLDVERNQNTNLNSTAVHYGIDHSVDLAHRSFDRIAYYVELKTPTGSREWVYVSMDAFTTDLSMIGVPNDASGAIWDTAVTNLNVFSNASGVTTGLGLTGAIEFWADNYQEGLNGVYDYDDNIFPTVGGYGSMQIHLPGLAQTLFAYNGWGNAGFVGDLGIGNRGTSHPDWTFANNAAGYEIANIFVLVRVVPAPSALPVGLVLLGLLAARRRRRRA